MLKDGAAILPLCIVPFYAETDTADNGEFTHKAPVLLDKFFLSYKFEWDLTTKRVKSKIFRLNAISCGIAAEKLNLSFSYFVHSKNRLYLTSTAFVI
jgi:hypothetical protein